MSNKHPLEQAVLDDYNKWYEVYINICFLIHQAKMEDEAKDIYELAMQKSAGTKMMIDYMNKTDTLPTKQPIENNLFNDPEL